MAPCVKNLMIWIKAQWQHIQEARASPEIYPPLVRKAKRHKQGPVKQFLQRHSDGTTMIDSIAPSDGFLILMFVQSAGGQGDDRSFTKAKGVAMAACQPQCLDNWIHHHHHHLIFSDEKEERHVKPLFRKLKEEWAINLNYGSKYLGGRAWHLPTNHPFN